MKKLLLCFSLLVSCALQASRKPMDHEVNRASALQQRHNARTLERAREAKNIVLGLQIAVGMAAIGAVVPNKDIQNSLVIGGVVLAGLCAAYEHRSSTSYEN